MSASGLTRCKVSLLALLLSTTYAWAAPSFVEVKASYHPSDTLVLDRQGEVLQRAQRAMAGLGRHLPCPADRTGVERRPALLRTQRD
jgi:hypothetical protein